MEEKGRISDWFNSLNGNKELRDKALKKSNKLAELNINSIGQIERIYKATDFLAFYDPTKLNNLELFGMEGADVEQMIVAEVPDLSLGSERGYNVYQFINLSDSGKMKSGDILTLDPTVEGKEAATTLDPDFEKFLAAKFREANPKYKTLSDEDILKGLDVKNWSYEKVVYMMAKSTSIEEQLQQIVETPEGKKNFFGRINDKERLKSAGYLEENEQELEDAENEQEEEGMTIEEASEILGIEEEKLREVAGDNGKILGISRTNRVEQLSKQLDFDFSENESEVVLLKVAGPGLKGQGMILSKDGSPICTPKQVDTSLITELVKDGSNNEFIEDIDEKLKQRDAESRKIETIDPLTGRRNVEFAEKGNKKAIEGYESDAQEILQELEERMRIIESGPGKESEKLSMKAEVLFSAKGRLEHLQEAYGIQEKDSVDKLESQAKETAQESEEQEFMEVGKDVMKTALGIAAASAGLEGFDPRDPNYKRENGLDRNEKLPY